MAAAAPQSVRARAGALLRRPWVMTALLCAAALALPATGTDAAAQEFRTWLWVRHGPVLWQNLWYGGHSVVGYSVLFPPLAAVLGTRVAGAVATVWAAAAGGAAFVTFGRSFGGSFGGARAATAATAAGYWFAFACVGMFIQGQYPFALGVALAITALLAAGRDRPVSAGALALAASAASPLAGAFLLLFASAWWAQAGLRRVAPLGCAVAGVALGWWAGGGGWFPFPGVSLLSVLIACGGGLLLVWWEGTAVRAALLGYAACAVVLFALPNAVGGNAARLGALAGGPLAVHLLGRRGRWRTVLVVALPLAVWTGWPVGSALAAGVGDPSGGAAYYAGLQQFLSTQDPARGRLEIPPLRRHWESYFVATRFPLARGWERQIDLGDDAVLYRPGLTGDELHAWTLDAGVRLIALPDAPLDPWAVREAALLAAGQPWLVPVWHDAHWQVWEVADAVGLVTGPARVVRLGVDSVDLDMTAAGQALVRLRWGPFWRVTAGSACLAEGGNGWLVVGATAPGPVTVSADALPGTGPPAVPECPATVWPSDVRPIERPGLPR